MDGAIDHRGRQERVLPTPFWPRNVGRKPARIASTSQRPGSLRSPNAAKVLATMASVWLATCLAATGLATAAPATPAWSLLPQPANVRLAGSGVVKIPDGGLVAVRGADRQQVQPIADRFIQLVASTRGLQLHAAPAAAEAHPTITFETDPNASVVGDSGYRIEVGAQGIRIIARAPS